MENESAAIFYRGGSNFEARPYEVRIDPETNYVKPTHGISIHQDAERVKRFGGAYKIVFLPDTLKIVQRGRDRSHHEIVPREANPNTAIQPHPMTETTTINTQLIDTLSQIILALNDEERHILIHKLLTPNQASDSTKAHQETLKQEIAIGAQQLQRGQYTEYDDTSLPNLLVAIKQRGQQRLEQE